MCVYIYIFLNLSFMLKDITVQISDFELMMKESRPNLPLVLILDSLDQLDHAYNARQMTWLLPKLAPTTKVILSTLPEPIYQCLPALQVYYCQFTQQFCNGGL
jgi:hypothetical protein